MLKIANAYVICSRHGSYDSPCTLVGHKIACWKWKRRWARGGAGAKRRAHNSLQDNTSARLCEGK